MQGRSHTILQLLKIRTRMRPADLDGLSIPCVSFVFAPAQNRGIDIYDGGRTQRIDAVFKLGAQNSPVLGNDMQPPSRRAMSYIPLSARWERICHSDTAVMAVKKVVLRSASMCR